MTAVVSLRNAGIRRGREIIVRNVSFDICAGEVTGLIGPNGAGKSTTIGGLLGYYPITSGTLRLGDWEFTGGAQMPPEVKRRIAYIPEQPLYYPDLTLAEHLEWKVRLWRLSQPGQVDTPQQVIADLTNRFELQPHLGKFPHQCSKGTLQKLMVVLAFLFPFDVLIVDEPFVGLDVIAIRHVRELIEQARTNGAAVLLSTHVLDAAERMCQRFALMMDGEIFAQGSLSELRATFGDDTMTLEELFIRLYRARRGNVR